MRYIIIHRHIFKNAGTTLDAALEEQFGKSFVAFHDEGGDGIITNEMLHNFLAANPAVIAISSHHFHGYDYVFGNDMPIRIINFVLIRNPIDRLRSIYNFYRRGQDGGPVSLAARAMNPRQFIEHLLEVHPHMIDNMQVNLIANRGFYTRPVSNFDLDRAWNRIRDYAICATVERYDEAMVIAEHCVSANFFPTRINLSSARQNVAIDGMGDQQFRSDLGDLAETVLALNSYDTALWMRASQETDHRSRIVPDFASKVAAFAGRRALKEPITESPSG